MLSMVAGVVRSDEDGPSTMADGEAAGGSTNPALASLVITSIQPLASGNRSWRRRSR